MSFFDDVWGGVTDVLGESWDFAKDVTGQVVEQTMQTMRDSGVDTATLKDKEPIKGAATDGTTIVGGASAASQRANTQWITGVDNKLVMIGGGIAGLLALVLVVKAVK